MYRLFKQWQERSARRRLRQDSTHTASQRVELHQGPCHCPDHWVQGFDWQHEVIERLRGISFILGLWQGVLVTDQAFSSWYVPVNIHGRPECLVQEQEHHTS